ncbi:MAG: fibronectin type III domain-containing protein, partial [Selenomonadaceae bacterium]|nr:fibronectin type III domain-containing protein [Selenomonadaceae bacterium]
MEQMNRRNFLKFLVGGVFLLGGGAFLSKGAWYRQAANGVRELAGDLDAQYLRQIIAADPSTSRTLMWQSAAPLSNPRIEYRQKRQEEAAAVSASEDFFTDDGVTNYQY